MTFCLREKWLEIMRHQAVEQAVWEQAVVTPGEFALILAREFVGGLSPAFIEPLETDPRAVTGRHLVALPGPGAVPDFVKMANREIWRAEQYQPTIWRSGEHRHNSGVGLVRHESALVLDDQPRRRVAA